MKISFLDKIRDKIEETITSYYQDPNQFTEFEINKLYNNLNNRDFNNISSDDDDDSYNFNADNDFTSCNEENLSENCIKFYNNF